MVSLVWNEQEKKFEKLDPEKKIQIIANSKYKAWKWEHKDASEEEDKRKKAEILEKVRERYKYGFVDMEE